MDVLRGLLHDTTGDTSGHHEVRARPDGWPVGPLVVGDERLSGLGADVDVSVVVSGGAGGLTALGRRTSDLRLVAAETTLRDLDDLLGNAARVVAARESLPEEVDVFVGIPAGRAFVEAVEVVEAAGLLARVDLATGRTGSVAEELSVLVEADLPFKVAGTGTDALGPYGVVAVLMAVEALIDGADPAEAEELLVRVDAHRAAAALSGWDEATQARVRRRLQGVDCADVTSALDALGSAGLL